jgi:hypothetical protein
VEDVGCGMCCGWRLLAVMRVPGAARDDAQHREAPPQAELADEVAYMLCNIVFNTRARAGARGTQITGCNGGSRRRLVHA